MTPGYHPLVVIGAPRSGANMLRDVSYSLGNVAIWLCDEINYIWRHDNLCYPSDGLPPEQAMRRLESLVGAILKRYGYA